jgi:hypothetical protein
LVSQSRSVDGTKKSLKGFLIVEGENGNYTVRDGVTREESMAGSLNPVFLDGQLINETNLSAVRRRVAE